MATTTCVGCGRKTDNREHCKFPSVDRITGVEGRFAKPGDAMPLYEGAAKRRQRARAITAQNRLRV